jgi:hypothetical protein
MQPPTRERPCYRALFLISLTPRLSSRRSSSRSVAPSE